MFVLAFGFMCSVSIIKEPNVTAGICNWNVFLPHCSAQIANSLQSKNWKFKTWLIRWKWKPNRNFNPHHKYALICKHVLGFGNCPSMFQAIILSYLQDCLSFYWIKSRFKYWRTIDDKFEFINAFQGQPERNSIWNSYCKFSIKFE